MELQDYQRVRVLLEYADRWQLGAFKCELFQPQDEPVLLQVGHAAICSAQTRLLESLLELRRQRGRWNLEG